MPADTKNRLLVQPEDPNATIWKYMDLPELIYLLQERKLWFSRLDMLGDPFEGSVQQSLLDTVTFPTPPGLADTARPHIEAFSKAAMRRAFYEQRLCNYVSCWSMQDKELMALWRSYRRSDFSVAIRSTYAILRDQLPNIPFGKVFYTNFSHPVDLEMIGKNIFHLSIRKHEALRFENEIRAIYPYLHIQELHPTINVLQPVAVPVEQFDFEKAFPLPDVTKLPKGEPTSVEVNTLVMEIRSNPTCPDWFIPQLKKLCEGLGYKGQVSRSILDPRDWTLI